MMRSAFMMLWGIEGKIPRLLKQKCLHISKWRGDSKERTSRNESEYMEEAEQHCHEIS
jgi:hypothetical protein